MAWWRLVFGAVCISASPVLVKSLVLDGLGPSAIGLWRCAFGALLILPFSVAVAGRSALRPRLLPAVFTGTLFAVNLVAGHLAIRYIGAGIATIVASTQVFWASAIGSVFYADRVGARFVAAACVAVVGLTLLVGFGVPDVSPGAHALGVAAGVVNGALYGAFVAAMRRTGLSGAEGGNLALLPWLSAVAAVVSIGPAIAEPGAVLPASFQGWARAVALGGVAQALGWWAIATGLPRVPGGRGALVLLLQPVLATVWGAWMYGERLGPLQIAGAAVTLAAIHAGTRSQAAGASNRQRTRA